jgi:hypothetical protein
VVTSFFYSSFFYSIEADHLWDTSGIMDRLWRDQDEHTCIV